MVLVADFNNQFQLQESIDETLFRGESMGYRFNGTFLLDESKQIDFVCVRIKSVNQRKDQIETNNEQCKEGFSKQLFIAAYPNPAEDYLTLDFVLPKAGKVIIKIVDNLGREVLHVTDASFEEGYYSSKINVSNLKNGLYHYLFRYNGVQEEGHFLKQ